MPMSVHIPIHMPIHMPKHVYVHVCTYACMQVHPRVCSYFSYACATDKCQRMPSQKCAHIPMRKPLSNIHVRVRAHVRAHSFTQKNGLSLERVVHLRSHTGSLWNWAPSANNFKKWAIDHKVPDCLWGRWKVKSRLRRRGCMSVTHVCTHVCNTCR